MSAAEEQFIAEVAEAMAAIAGYELAEESPRVQALYDERARTAILAVDAAARKLGHGEPSGAPRMAS